MERKSLLAHLTELWYNDLTVHADNRIPFEEGYPSSTQDVLRAKKEEWNVVSSKGRIILVAAAVAALAAGLLFHQLYRPARLLNEQVVDSLLGAPPAAIDADPYDPETSAAFLEGCFESVREDPAFQRELADRLDQEILRVALDNADPYRGELVTNRYLEQPLPADAVAILGRLTALLARVDYEDDELREAIARFFLALSERPADGGAASETEARQAYNTAAGITQALEQAEAFNQMAGDFYQIPLEEIVSAEDLLERYSQAVRLAREEGDRETLIAALARASSSPLLEDREVMDSGEILAALAEDGSQLLTLRNGVGGYYDELSGEYLASEEYQLTVASGSTPKRTYCGDLCLTRTPKGGNWNILTPEQWEVLTPELREEVEEWLKEEDPGELVVTVFCRGEEIDLEMDHVTLEELAEQGYGYALLMPGGSAVYFSETAIRFSDAPDAIQGDLGDLYRELAETYQTEHPAPGEVELTQDELVQYEPYMGTFTDEEGCILHSTFQSDGGQIFWVCTIPEEHQYRFWLQIEDKAYTFLQKPLPVEDMTATETGTFNWPMTATVTFSGGQIRVVIGNEYEEEPPMIFTRSAAEEG